MQNTPKRIETESELDDFINNLPPGCTVDRELAKRAIAVGMDPNGAVSLPSEKMQEAVKGLNEIREPGSQPRVSRPFSLALLFKGSKLVKSDPSLAKLFSPKKD